MGFRVKGFRVLDLGFKGLRLRTRDYDGRGHPL
jgi:hypothetical protein